MPSTRASHRVAHARGRCAQVSKWNLSICLFNYLQEGRRYMLTKQVGHAGHLVVLRLQYARERERWWTVLLRPASVSCRLTRAAHDVARCSSSIRGRPGHGATLGAASVQTPPHGACHEIPSTRPSTVSCACASKKICDGIASGQAAARLTTTSAKSRMSRRISRSVARIMTAWAWHPHERCPASLPTRWRAHLQSRSLVASLAGLVRQRIRRQSRTRFLDGCRVGCLPWGIAPEGGLLLDDSRHRLDSSQ